MPNSLSGSRFDSVLDTAVDGIIVIDERARILVYNKACEALFGHSVDEVRGKNINVLMPTDYARHHDGYMANYISTGVKKIIGIGREVRGRHKDGTEFPLELSVGEALTPEGRQFIGILRDLRPRYAAEERLSQLQADLVHMARVSAINEMGAALAHEINQPLTAMMLYLQALTRAWEKSGQAKENQSSQAVLDKAVKEAERASAIIQRMRNFVEKRDPKRQHVNLDSLIDEALELTMTGMRRSATIERIEAPKGLCVSVDPVQIQQILVNLLRNACEAVHGQDNGLIHVSSGRTRGAAWITIKDNGPGIKAEDLPKLFKAFESGKKTGMGIGLAISRAIAQNHGGDLEVDPGGRGQGATFTLTIPMVAGDRLEESIHHDN
jgi:two-component system, LuxR family, sensor kinase FixL